MSTPQVPALAGMTPLGLPEFTMTLSRIRDWQRELVPELQDRAGRRRIFDCRDLAELVSANGYKQLTNCRRAFDKQVNYSKLTRPENWRADLWDYLLAAPRLGDDTLILACGDDGTVDLFYSLPGDLMGDRFDDHMEACYDDAQRDYGCSFTVGWTWDAARGIWARDTALDMG
jgi:hypothetical protein